MSKFFSPSAASREMLLELMSMIAYFIFYSLYLSPMFFIYTDFLTF